MPSKSARPSTQLITVLALTRVVWVILLTSLVALSPLGNFLLLQGLIGFLPTDLGVQTEAIVVLGRGVGPSSESRTDTAAELWQAQRAPLVFASGRPEAEALSQALQRKGVPPKALQGEDCSRTTEENALFTAAVLQPQGIHQILLLTDAPHMQRSLLTFQSLGFTAIPHITPLWSEFTARGLNQLLWYETLALLGYGLQGRFQSRSFTNPAYLTPEQLQKALSGGCSEFGVRNAE